MTTVVLGLLTYTLVGLLLLLVIFVYAHVETRSELRRINAQLTQAGQVSGRSRNAFSDETMVATLNPSQWLTK